MSELYTIDRTPTTDLEKFQALRIEALERELLKAKELLAEIQSGIESYVNDFEVKEVEVL
jgi:hypothetical protein